MKQTNYQLFDFLDFSPELNEGDRLWRACQPTAIEERDGTIYITIPFQKQQNSNEISPDTAAERKEYVLRISALGEKILRVSLAFAGEVMESSLLLEMDQRLTKNALSYQKNENEWIVSDASGTKKAVIGFQPAEIDWWSDLVPAPAETLSLSFYPDGKKEVKLSASVYFSFCSIHCL
jgi:alpha-D-xyloside xylohydrolase